MHIIKNLLKYLENKIKKNGEKYPEFKDLPKWILFLLASGHGIIASFCAFLLSSTLPAYYLIGNTTPFYKSGSGLTVTFILCLTALVLVITSYLFSRFSKILLDDAFFPKR